MPDARARPRAPRARRSSAATAAAASARSARARSSSATGEVAGVEPVVALVSTTAPVRRDRSTKQAARKPGIEPVCPTSIPEPPRASWKPRPCAQASAVVAVARLRVRGQLEPRRGRARRGGRRPGRRRSGRGRRRCDQSWPAGAIAPVSVAGSGVERARVGVDAPAAWRAAPRGQVRRAGHAERLEDPRRATASHQGVPRSRATTSPSSAKPRLE